MSKKVALVFLACLVFVANAQKHEDSIKNGFKNGISSFFHTKQISKEFFDFMDSLNFRNAYKEPETYIDPAVLCTACVEVGEAALEARRNGTSAEDLANLVIEACVYLGLDTRRVCEGLVNIMVDTGLYIVDNSPDIKADHLCAVVAQSYGCEGEVPEWSINIPEKASIPPKKSSTYDETPLRIAHITDIHYDPMYLAGSLAVCDTYVCCQSDLGIAENPDQAAGYWGDYRSCDSPLNVIQSAFESMKERGNYDAIYFTGDIISHRMFDTTPERVKEEVHTIHNELRKVFPGTPIFSTYGNHDSHPVNCYAPPSVTDETVSSQWLYDDTAELWGQDLTEEAKETVRRGGFYSVLVRPGFRVISINGNTGYLFNWWILFETDPLGQLQWLSDELYKAEQNGEMVHLLSHNPSSDGSQFTIWSREYRRIIARFSHIIKATFNGHTHQDEITLYHSIENPTEPISVAWNGGSVTTISNLNNNYKVFSVDPTNFELLDYEVWSMNVTEANLTPELNPVWFKLYSFKEEYGVEDLSPASIRDLAIRMTEDHSIAQKYWRNRHRLADTALAGGCSDGCLKNLVCRMLMSQTYDNTQCQEITGNW
ncbi:sphingomyelin phosphodiesterase-like [Onthophagus taurus]|uniref:sphingomyelin phosphodiesterase-like n=1 Tax=Onthophagus taurus TaxID=166361 RepID=UPI0039BEB539